MAWSSKQEDLTLTSGAPLPLWPKCTDDPKGDIDFGLMKVTGVDLANGADRTVITKIENQTVTIREYYNKMPTHDTYANPNCELYYQCNCGAVLDPGTKSFAALNNSASDTGWKIRFTDAGYVPYCVECGQGVE